MGSLQCLGTTDASVPLAKKTHIKHLMSYGANGQLRLTKIEQEERRTKLLVNKRRDVI